MENSASLDWYHFERMSQAIKLLSNLKPIAGQILVGPGCPQKAALTFLNYGDNRHRI